MNNIKNSLPSPTYAHHKTHTTTYTLSTYTLGNNRYELNDWLGNMRVVISDKKLPSSTTGTAVLSYKPQVLSTTDYYSFGSPVKERTYHTRRYRYGFNAKENIN